MSKGLRFRVIAGCGLRGASVSTIVLLQLQILRKIRFRLHHEQIPVLRIGSSNECWPASCWQWPQEGYSAPRLGPRPSKSYLQILSLPYEYQVCITSLIIFSCSSPFFQCLHVLIMAEPSATYAALSNLLQLRLPGCGACPPKTPGTPMNCLSKDCRSRM